MKMPNVFVIKRKRSPIKVIIIVASAVVAFATALAVIYKLLGNKIKSKIIGQVDIDGDGEADAIMLDTTGDGEVDTIILNTENSNA